MIEKKSRYAGIDLLRCLGLLFVVGVHSFLKNGFYSEPQTGALMWWADSWRWLFFCCNGIFLMITGYLKTTKPFGWSYYKSLIPIVVSYLLICLVSFPIRHFLLGEEKTFSQWVDVCLSFGNYAWYLEMYIGLLLLSPVINLALDGLQTPARQLTMGALLMLLTAAPSITAFNILPDYWVNFYPVTYYLIGALIRRLQPKWKSWLCLLSAAGIAMLLGLLSVLSTDGTSSEGYSQGYGGFFVTLLTAALFLGLYRLRIPERLGRILAWMAEGCFEGYLLSRLLDVWVYNLLPQWHCPEYYPLLFICITVPIYIFSILAGKGIHTLTRLCLSKFARRKSLC